MICGPPAGDLTFHVPASAGEVAGDRTRVVVGGDHLDPHDGLEQRRRGLLRRVLEGHGARDLEGHLRGVDVVEAAVVQSDLHVDDGIAGQDPAIQGLADALLDGLDVLLGDRSALDGVLEDEALSGGRLELDLGVPVLAAAAGLLDVATLALGRLADRLLVGDLGLADVGLDPELPLADGRPGSRDGARPCPRSWSGRCPCRSRPGRSGPPASAWRARCRASPGRSWSSARRRGR